MQVAIDKAPRDGPIKLLSTHHLSPSQSGLASSLIYSVLKDINMGIQIWEEAFQLQLKF